MKKTGVCIILSLCLLLGSIGVFAAEDIPSAWAQQEIDEAISRGLIPEALQNCYTENISRQDYAVLIVNFVCIRSGMDVESLVFEKSGKTLDEFIAETPFVDCGSSDVIAAYALGLVNGRGGGIFDPDSYIIRQESAALIMRLGSFFGQGAGATHLDFSDYELVHDYAVEAVNYVSSLDIMHGMGDGRFAPNEHFSRQQAYLCMLRLFNVLENPKSEWTGIFDEGTLFIGDSNTYHLITRYLEPMGYLGQADYMACPNAGLGHFFADWAKLTPAAWNFYGTACSEAFSGLTYAEAVSLSAGKYEHIYIMLGSNPGPNLSADAYKPVLDFIAAANPTAIIHVQTIPDCFTGIINSDYINRCIESVCNYYAEKGMSNIVKLDTNSIWVSGCVAYDGVHLTNTGLEAWYNYIAANR